MPFTQTILLSAAIVILILLSYMIVSFILSKLIPTKQVKEVVEELKPKHLSRPPKKHPHHTKVKTRHVKDVKRVAHNKSKQIDKKEVKLVNGSSKKRYERLELKPKQSSSNIDNVWKYYSN